MLKGEERDIKILGYCFARRSLCEGGIARRSFCEGGGL